MIKGQKLNVKVNNSRKKQYITVASICLVLLIVIGGTYAYWTTTKVQEDKNVINTTCLELIYENKTLAGNTTSPINLEKAYPISDAEGKALTGYTFTLRNECDSYVSYNVNLESLSEVLEDKRIKSEHIDTILNDGAVVGLTTYKNTTSLIGTDQTYEAKQLETGTLGPKGEGNDSIEYTLRMWIDKNTPDSEMSKSYKGKISIYGTVVAPENAIEKITKLANQPVAASADNTTQLVEDDTDDQNIRYIGADPDNYVDIGNGVYQKDIWIGYNSDTIYGGDYTVEYNSYEECNANTEYNQHCTQLHKKGDPILWRIIGVMKDADDQGTARLKIIRDEDIGMIAWDARCKSEESDETESCSSGYDYKNNWNNASLKETLNEAFWNRGITTKRNYVYVYDEENEWNDYWFKLNFENTGMREISRKLFDDTKWHLGGVTSNEYNKATVKTFYSKEHANETYEGNPPSTNAMVGLMYASDYGYATSGGGTTTRETCLETELYNWDGEEECFKNDWLYDPSDYQWLMNPYASRDDEAARVDSDGFVYGDSDYVSNSDYRIRPVLYLKSDVKIVSGNGTKENPYKLTI